MGKFMIYYLFMLNTIGVSLLVSLYVSPGAVILTLVLLVLFVATFLFNLGVIFLALIFIIVYVGAVMILYVYSLSTLRERLQGFNRFMPIYWYLLLAYLLFFLFAQMAIIESFGNITNFISDYDSMGINSGIIGQDRFFYIFLFRKYSELSTIGVMLYTKYVYLFIVSAIMLLVTLIGSLSILIKKK